MIVPFKINNTSQTFMKRTFILKALFCLFLAATAFSACKKEDPKEKLSVSVTELTVPETGNKVSFTVTSGEAWILEQKGDYQFIVTPDYGEAGTTEVQVSADLSSTSTEKTGTITIRSGNESKDIKVKVETSEEKYKTGEYNIYMESEKLNPAVLIFTGDGYTSDDLVKGGKFDQEINEAIESFFSVEPYKTFREYFTVYKIAAESEEEGISIRNQVTKNTMFSCLWEGQYTTQITCDFNKVFDFVSQIEGVDNDVIRNGGIAVIINADVYAGTCQLYSDNRCIAMIPVDRSSGHSMGTLKRLVVHEFGGHGFGKLADEYTTNRGEAPQNIKDDLDKWHKYNHFLNMSTTDDKNMVPWKAFLDHPEYPQVSIIEGGYYYTNGTWRSETISCMMDNRLYYNTQSRYLIMKRIMNIAGEEFDMDFFIQHDNQKFDDTENRSYVLPEDFIPLAPPILVEL